MSEPIYGLADPNLTAQMSGMQFVSAMAAGLIPRPPMNRRIPLEMKEWESGRLVLRATVDGTYLNPGGIVHGGFAMTALDTAMGLAVLTTLGRGKGFASTDTSVRFVRPLPGGETHEVEITGIVVSTGRSIATASGEIRLSNGKLVATGTSACVIVGSRRE